MNIVFVPLIGTDEAKWFPPGPETPSYVENFCRLFLPPPDSELRKAASEVIGSAQDALDAESAPNIKGGWEPNGFLVVDAGGELLLRIARYIIKVLAVTNAQQAGLLKVWARLLAARRPIATVWRVEQVSITREDGSALSAGETAKDLVTVLNGSCDAVVAFETDGNLFRLRPKSGAATAVTALYRSCDLNDWQDKLRATWHWDRDVEEHCEWLGINPPHLTKRNEKIIGAALMFESRIIIADQYIGQTLCKDLLYDKYWIDQGCDENVVFQAKWGPRWLDSLCFLLTAWRKAALGCGNTGPRACTVVTAVHPDDWRDVLWFFVAKAERFLSACLEGEVRFDIRATPARKQGREEIHPRYIFASTRAIQSDRGFDLVEIKREQPTFRYAEIASRTCHEARHSRNSWTGAGLVAIPRQNFTDAELEWMPTMTTRSLHPAITPTGDQTGDSRTA